MPTKQEVVSNVQRVDLHRYRQLRAKGEPAQVAWWQVTHRRAVDRAETDEAVRFTWEYDPDYEVEMPCDIGHICLTPDDHDAHRKFYDEEVEALDSGRWEALGVIVERPVATGGGYLPLKVTWKEVGSLWGIVVAEEDDKRYYECEMLPDDLYERYK